MIKYLFVFLVSFSSVYGALNDLNTHRVCDSLIYHVRNKPMDITIEKDKPFVKKFFLLSGKVQFAAKLTSLYPNLYSYKRKKIKNKDTLHVGAHLFYDTCSILDMVNSKDKSFAINDTNFDYILTKIIDPNF